MQAGPRKPSARTRLRFVVALLVGAMLAMVAWHAAVVYIPNQARVSALAENEQALEALAAASHALARERTAVLADVGAAGPERTDLRETMAQKDARMEALLERIGELEGQRPGLRSPRRELEESWKELRGIRGESVANDGDMAATWWEMTERLGAAMDWLRQSLLADIEGDDELLRHNFALRDTLAALREALAREQALLATALAPPATGEAEGAFSAVLPGASALQRDFDRADRRIRTHTEHTRSGNGSLYSFARFLPRDDEPARAAVGEAWEGFRSSFREEFLPAQAMAAEVRAGDEVAVELAYWLEVSDQALARLDDVTAAVGESAAQRTAILQQDARWSLGLLALMALAVPAIGAVAWIIVERIGRRLETLAQTLGLAAADHDLAVRAQAEPIREIDRVATAFNELQARFESLVGRIVAAGGSAAGEMQNLSAMAGQVAGGADQQSDDLQNLAAAVEQMAASIAKVEQNTSVAAEAASQAEECAREGRETVGEAAEVIDRLHEQTRNIGKVLATIDGIASQTNMLSLNASVEAARAGHHGRGFAVVAEEVRALASKTREATNEVGSLLASFRDEAARARETMLAREAVPPEAGDGEESGTESGKESSNGGGDQRTADAALEAIVASVSKIRALSDEVARAVSEQSRVSIDISQRVHRVSGIAGETSEAARESSRSAGSARDHVDQLRETAGRFRVSDRAGGS